MWTVYNKFGGHATIASVYITGEIEYEIDRNKQMKQIQTTFLFHSDFLKCISFQDFCCFNLHYIIQILEGCSNDEIGLPSNHSASYSSSYPGVSEEGDTAIITCPPGFQLFNADFRLLSKNFTAILLNFSGLLPISSTVL